MDKYKYSPQNVGSNLNEKRIQFSVIPVVENVPHLPVG